MLDRDGYLANIGYFLVKKAMSGDLGTRFFIIKIIHHMKKETKYGWYIIAGIIFTTFTNVPVRSELEPLKVGVELITIIVACYFYYWVKKKIKFEKNEFIKSIVSGVVTIILFSFLGICTLGILGGALLYYKPENEQTQEVETELFESTTASELDTLTGEITLLKGKMDYYESIGDNDSYNELVPEYNEKIEEAQQYIELYQEYQGLTGTK